MDNVQYGKKQDTPFRKTFVLKQQTPMIHFQHADSGAVIRASEFKPKMDKFLVKKLGEEKVNDDWKLKQTDSENNEKPKTLALNYKVKIWSMGKPQKSKTVEYTNEFNDLKKLYNEPKNIPKDKKNELNRKFPKINGMYFGNMGNVEEYKETVFYKDCIYVEIYCFVEGLLKYISDNMAEFLLVTNFGTRQSKGFGGFALVADSEEKYIEPINLLDEGNYKYIYGNFANCKDKLKAAQAIYSVMKGGINRSWNKNEKKYEDSKYIKGYIQRAYLDERDKDKTEKIGSDKAFMKGNVIKTEYPSKIEAQKDNYTKYKDFEYVRAILGTADKVEFKDRVRKGTVNISSDAIERFGSSIQINIWNNYIFLIMKDEEYIRQILNKKFKFTYKSQKGNNVQTISTPKEFDVDKFLEGFVNYYNTESWKLKNLSFGEAADVELLVGNGGDRT